MIILEDDNYQVKNKFIRAMLEATVPNFDWNSYDYNRYDDDFQYNHIIVSNLIDNEIEGINVLTKDVERDEHWYDDNEFIVFEYQGNIYKVNFTEGSQGFKYKLELDTLKSVTAKTKEVVYYE
jgi:hypothetical protein